MSTIRILPDTVANQIAAGEVIERPAGVVKELVENAIDAGATRVEVEYRNGGRSFLRVEDNGSGMSQEEALLALERHATSKIRQASDLLSVQSFGFRGEALPSIASVSKFVLRTKRPEDPEGTEIIVDSGKIRHVKSCGMPPGTRIEVRQLFAPVPARRKFLKTDLTEAGHIVQTLRLQALANPETAFRVTEGPREVFNTAVCPGLRERIGEIYGWSALSDLLPIPPAGERDLELKGFILQPGRPGRSTRQDMLSFVNRRPVQNRTLTYALLESYHNLLPRGRYPQAFLFLTIDPAGVDVNVHPAKREIRFRDESRVRSFVIRHLLPLIRNAAKPHAEISGEKINRPTPRPENLNTLVSPSPQRTEPEKNSNRSTVTPEPAASNSGERAQTAVPDSPEPHRSSPSSTPSVATPKPPEEPPSPPPNSSNKTKNIPSPSSAPWRENSWIYLGDWKKRFALFEAPSGLVMLHLKAARQRIQFEKVLRELQATEITSQPLLFPQPLELDPVSSGLMEETRGVLNQKGFRIEPFGRHFFRIEAVPNWLDPASAEDFLRDLLHLAKEEGWNPQRMERSQEDLARLASRWVSNSGVLNSDTMRWLLKSLMECETPTVCPRGHPTYWEITESELNRRFRIKE
ncbi:MAG: DNA mismatch repair endonuclease MutL [Opitutales bacterium]|nr:DNA mismatch repair endonuclease MutL [Opitutales bacterium]MCH8540297.1 DNA mismatch repair endonuclease MutL [Opitutales bacterium]